MDPVEAALPEFERVGIAADPLGGWGAVADGPVRLEHRDGVEGVLQDHSELFG